MVQSLLLYNVNFNYYVGVARPTNQETNATEKTVCYTHRYPRERDILCHAGPQGHWGQQGGRGSGKNTWARGFIVVSWEGMGDAV